MPLSFISTPGLPLSGPYLPWALVVSFVKKGLLKISPNSKTLPY